MLARMGLCFASMSVVLLSLAGCQAHTQMPTVKVPHERVGLAVEDIHVQISGQSLGEDISGQWVGVPFASQVQNWFSSRFRPAGGERVGYIVINLASFKESKVLNLEPQEGKASDAPQEQYEAQIDVRFEIRDPMGFAETFSAAKVHRASSVFGDITLAQREALVQTLINRTLEDADQELLKSTKEFLPLVIQP